MTTIDNKEHFDHLISQIDKVSKWIEIMFEKADDLTLEFIKDCGKEAFKQ